MVKIKLPDGTIREYENPITPLAVAGDISESLARAAIAAEVDGTHVDMSFEIPDGEHQLTLFTDRNPESLEILRHTAAHVLAQAVIRLFGDKVKYAIGPALTDDFQYGFYYDFDLPETISLDDLPRIEDEMKKIVKEKIPIQRLDVSIDEGLSLLSERGQNFKEEMIRQLKTEDDATEISLYRQGEFLDMCRGPHLPDTGRLKKGFCLQAVAGAYWLGDEANPMLTRIYGNAFFGKKDLAAHLERVQEAKKRDHRVIGKELGLFLLDDKVGPGLPMWLPNGAIIKMELETWIRSELIKAGYSIVYSPHIGRLNLYQTSGHYPYYSDSQFPPISTGEDEMDGFLLKPMNCPHHLQMYKSSQHSHRNLPLRLAEFGQVYRWEQSGELNGLTRVRGFCQDDAHIFCTPDQLEEEIESCVNITKMVLSTLELTDYRVRIGLRDPESDKYVGDDANWNIAEDNIRSVIRKLDMDFIEEEGEAAFYGPKIDFIVKDCIGREWQLGTIQVDYNLPERFDLEYIGPDNTPHRPVMIHRAPFGSFERFIGILIEHFAGAFPLWLSPVQVAVLPVSDRFADYATMVNDMIKSAGIRSRLDDSSDRIGGRIRRATLEKIPYMIIAGEREQTDGTISLRTRSGGDIGAMKLDDFISGLILERDSRGSAPLVEK